MNRQHLLELLRVAEAIPEDHIHMGAFRTKLDCGTVYCLAGYAALDPYFQRHGLKIKFRQRIGDTYTGPENFDRLIEFFGLERDDAYNLFAGYMNKNDNPIRKETVIENIDRLLRGEHALPYDPDTGGFIEWGYDENEEDE